MGTGRDTVVGRLVGEVATVTFRAYAGEEECLADGDLGGVVGEAAFCAIGTSTCESVRKGDQAYRQGRHDVV